MTAPEPWAVEAAREAAKEIAWPARAHTGDAEVVAILARHLERARASAPEPPIDDENRMDRIDNLIARMQRTRERFGNTCVYIRRGGLSWGAVALNREADDKKFGVFDLQAQHERDMIQRGEQIERLIADRDSECEARWKCEKALADKDKAMSILFERLAAAGVDCSDLIP